MDQKIVMTRDQLEQQLAGMRHMVTKGKRETTDILRMIDLARQSPRAALNVDFIDRVEQTWSIRKRDIANMEQAADELEVYLKTMPKNVPPPTPPKPTDPGPESA